MKTVIRKAFWDYEKEERWLNEKAAHGYALIDYSWCRYVFEESSPGEYIYRLELLEKPANDEESLHYIRFMEESGVEHVASYFRWVYFRRKSAEGAFDIYSDIDSRIKHDVRIFRLWLGLMIAQMAAASINISAFVINELSGSYNPVIEFNLIAGGITLAAGLVFLTLALRSGRRVLRMKRDRYLTE